MAELGPKPGSFGGKATKLNHTPPLTTTLLQQLCEPIYFKNIFWDLKFPQKL